MRFDFSFTLRVGPFKRRVLLRSNQTMVRNERERGERERESERNRKEHVHRKPESVSSGYEWSGVTFSRIFFNIETSFPSVNFLRLLLRVTYHEEIASISEFVDHILHAWRFISMFSVYVPHSVDQRVYSLCMYTCKIHGHTHRHVIIFSQWGDLIQRASRGTHAWCG